MKPCAILISLLCCVIHCMAQDTLQHPLTDSVRTLREVEVQGKRPVLGIRPDGLVYRVNASLLPAAGSVEDLLRKVPLVSVNQEGLISVQGSSRVKVLIDNKPAEIYGSTADALRFLSAAAIDSVQVITVPGARYEAEGVAAVIRIYTKKQWWQGLSGNVEGMLGTRSMKSWKTGLNYRIGKVTLRGAIDQFYFTYELEKQLERNSHIGQQQSSLLQHGHEGSHGRHGHYSFNTDIAFDSLHSLTMGGEWGIMDYFRITDQDTRFFLEGMTRQYSRHTDYSGPNGHDAYSLTYAGHFSHKRELSIVAAYRIFKPVQQYAMEQSEAGIAPYMEQYREQQRNRETTAQLDYIHPFGRSNRLEAGWKGDWREMYSDYHLSSYDAAKQAFMTDTARSNRFFYRRSVQAAYISYEKGIGAWQLRLGLRYELTTASAVFGDTTASIPHYRNWAPNFLLSRTIGDKHTFKLSYRLNIERPSVFNLSPAVNYSDSLNVSRGNPELLPAVTRYYELSYQYQAAADRLISITAFYRPTKDVMDHVTFVEKDGIAVRTVQNIGRQRSLGLSNNITWAFGKKLSMNATLNISYESLKSPGQGLSNSGVFFFATCNISWQPVKGYTAALAAYYESPYIALQGTVTGWKFYDLTLTRRFLKDKAAVSLQLQSFFSKYLYIRTRYADPFFTQTMVDSNHNRFFKLSFGYTLNRLNRLNCLNRD